MVVFVYILNYHRYCSNNNLWCRVIFFFWFGWRCWVVQLHPVKEWVGGRNTFITEVWSKYSYHVKFFFCF